MSFHKALSLYPFTLQDALNAFGLVPVPFELHRYPLRLFIDVMYYNYMLIVSILQSLEFIRD